MACVDNINNPGDALPSLSCICMCWFNINKQARRMNQVTQTNKQTMKKANDHGVDVD